MAAAPIAVTPRRIERGRKLLRKNAALLARIERESDDLDLLSIARSDYRKDLLSTLLYGMLTVIVGVAAVFSLTGVVIGWRRLRLQFSL